MPPQRRKAAPPEEPSDFPTLDWTGDGFALTYQMLEILAQYDGLCRTIWAKEGEAATGKTKTEVYREVATKLLQNLPTYGAWVSSPTSNGTKHFGSMIKGKITKLQEQYHAAKERLGVTGSGLPSEEHIWQGTDLMKVWTAVKKICPYFYELKDLIGKRTAVCDHAITNSGTDMGGVNFMRRGTVDTPEDDEEEFPLDPTLGSVAYSSISNTAAGPSTARPSNTVGPSSQSSTEQQPQIVVTPAATSSAEIHQNTDTRNLQVPVTSSQATIRRSLVRKSSEPSSKQEQELESSLIVQSRSSTPNLQTSAEKQATCATANLKRKSTLGELGNTLGLMVETSEKRRRLRDKNIENTKLELDSSITQRLKRQLNFDLRIAELAETRAARKSIDAEQQAARESTDRQAEKQYQLEMRRLDLLEKGITLPTNPLFIQISDNLPVKGMSIKDGKKPAIAASGNAFHYSSSNWETSESKSRKESLGERVESKSIKEGDEDFDET